MGLTANIDRAWAALADSGQGSPTRFDPATVADLPPPAVRWLTQVVPEGTPLVDAVTIEMTGEIKLGGWMPFTARQILRAGVGFVWRPLVGGVLLRFTGADILTPDEARMEFRLHGLIKAVKATGPDTARSAAGRLAAETVVWLPQAVTPQAGASWRAVDDERAVVTLDAAGESVDVEVTVDGDGRLVAVLLDRWNGGADPPGYHPFGGELGEELTTSSGVRVSGAGSVGWGFGTPAWPEGEFFRYEVTSVEPVG